MPERLELGLSSAVLKFAAGDDARREQISSTWYVRVTRGFEIYVLNREAGGQRAHLSFHKDGRCHYKVENPLAKGGSEVVAQWGLPDPIEPTGMLRLGTVVIPHRGLVVPASLGAVDPETVLIPPPGPGEQLEVDIFFEPGTAPRGVYPAQSSGQGTLYVGRLSLYTEDQPDGFAHCTLVSTPRPEGATSVLLSEANVNYGGGMEPLAAPRMVHFEIVEVDGHKLPVLTEMPIGHMNRPSVGDDTS